MRSLFLSVLLVSVAAGCASNRRAGYEPGRPPFLPADPADLLVVGSVRVDRVNRCVLAEGWLNQSDGLIELLACGPEGKTHESVVVLDVEAVDLNAALLLLGLEPGRPPKAPGEGRPDGPPVDIWVEWEATDGPRRLRGEDLVYDRVHGEALRRSPWVYTGTVRDDGTLLATHGQSLVATFWDPWALINLPLPCGNDDEALSAHRDAAPSPGTPVTVRFHPVGRR